MMAGGLAAAVVSVSINMKDRFLPVDLKNSTMLKILERVGQLEQRSRAKNEGKCLTLHNQSCSSSRTSKSSLDKQRSSGCHQLGFDTFCSSTQAENDEPKSRWTGPYCTSAYGVLWAGSQSVSSRTTAADATRPTSIKNNRFVCRLYIRGHHRCVS